MHCIYFERVLKDFVSKEVTQNIFSSFVQGIVTED